MAFQSKYLHTRIRVKDLEETIRFYTEVFGFKEVRRSTSPAGNKLAFLELPGNDTLIELAWSPDMTDFDFPEDIFHFAFTVEDLDQFRNQWEPKGIEFWPEDGPVEDRFYFIDDPNGYEIEVMRP